MRFAPTEEQAALAEAVRALPRDATWAQIAELGILGVLAPESAGGMGLGLVEATVVLEACAMLEGPLVETVMVAAPVLGLEVVSGRVVATAGVTDAAWADRADVVLLLEGDAAVEARALDPTVPLDPRRPVARCVADGARHPAPGAFDRAALGAAAYLFGLSTRMLDLAIAHATVREQFGRPIGSFQAVQHHLANVALRNAYARPLLWRAALTGAPMHVSMAKLRCSQAAVFAARTALQVHGAIGYTTEHALHLHMKRAWSLARSWGDDAFHRARIASVLETKEIWDD